MFFSTNSSKVALISKELEERHPVPPQSKMGPITDSERTSLIQNSSLYMKYENKVDDVSAFEKILLSENNVTSRQQR